MKSYRYTLTLEKEAENIVRIIKVEGENKLDDFEKQVRAGKTPKVYVIKHKELILYVGYASQPIRSRLRYGLNPGKRSLKNGYHGYKWKNIDKVELYVWPFEPFSKFKTKEGQKGHKLYVEAVEAEVVFLCRKHFDKWPEFQHEIHFNNEDERAKEVAEEIFKLVTNREE